MVEIQTGIVFKIKKSSNFDKIVHILTNEGNNITALLKHRKTKYPLDDLEIGSLVLVDLIGNYSINIIKNVAVINRFAFWKSDYNSIVLLSSICDILAYLTANTVSEIEIFELVKEILSIDRGEKKLLFSVFVLRLLSLQGVLRSFSEYKEYLDLEDEGFLPLKSSDTDASYVEDKDSKLPLRLVKIQKYMLSVDLEEVIKLKISAFDLNDLLNIHIFWLSNVLGKEIKIGELI